MTYKVYSISITDKKLQEKLNKINKDPTKNLSKVIEGVLKNAKI